MTQDFKAITDVLALALAMVPKHERNARLSEAAKLYVKSLDREFPTLSDAEVEANVRNFVEAAVRRLEEIERSSGGAVGSA